MTYQTIIIKSLGEYNYLPQLKGVRYGKIKRLYSRKVKRRFQ